MDLTLIFLTAIIQTLVLFLLRKQKTFRLQWILSIFALFLVLFIFPESIVASKGVNDVNCGLPAMAVRINFWLVGILATIIATTIGYVLWWNNKQAQEKSDTSKKEAS